MHSYAKKQNGLLYAVLLSLLSESINDRESHMNTAASNAYFAETFSSILDQIYLCEYIGYIL